jgi:hypothetical protein
MTKAIMMAALVMIALVMAALVMAAMKMDPEAPAPTLSAAHRTLRREAPAIALRAVPEWYVRNLWA